MSLKRMAMGLAIAFAASKGMGAVRRSGGLRGLQRQLSGGGRSGGLGGMLAGLGGGGTSTGGLGSILGALGGSGAGGGLTATGGRTHGRGMAGQGGLGGLLGGLAAMAGGSGAAGQMSGAADDDQMMRMAEQGAQDEATAGVMIRAMVQAARADGRIDADEREALVDVLGDAEGPGDRAALEAAMEEPINPESLARDVPRGHESEVYAAALTAIDPDAEAEKDYLRRLATALSLDPQAVRQLHEMQDKPI